MHNGCQLAAKRNRKWPRWKLLPSLTISNREWHMMSIPTYALENWKTLWPGWERTPKISSHTSRPDGLLWDDQWWALQARTTLPYCPCILPWGKAPRETYGQAIQDTLQWAGWHCCEPLHHPTCQGTSLPQHQTCGHNLPGPKADSPHQPQQPWSYTICTLQGLSQLHPAGRANCPACDSCCSKCDKMGHWRPKCCGGKPLQPRNVPPPGSQQRKSRCPPRNHNHCQGQKNKTDTIDVREDHSPQDEIALHHIQPGTTAQQSETLTPKKSWLEMSVPQNAMRHTPPSSCLQCQQKGNSLTLH